MEKTKKIIVVFFGLAAAFSVLSIFYSISGGVSSRVLGGEITGSIGGLWFPISALIVSVGLLIVALRSFK